MPASTSILCSVTLFRTSSYRVVVHWKLQHQLSTIDLYILHVDGRPATPLHCCQKSLPHVQALSGIAAFAISVHMHAMLSEQSCFIKVAGGWGRGAAATSAAAGALRIGSALGRHIRAVSHSRVGSPGAAPMHEQLLDLPPAPK